MKKWILRLLCVTVLLSLCLSVPMAAAAEIDPGQEASLTVVYQYSGEAYEGLEIRLFRVADVGDDFAFSLSGQFAAYPVSLEGITSQTEWKVICQTLEAYVWADGLTPTATVVTDANGTVKFENLTPGLYLATTINHLGETGIVEFSGFLTVLPGLAEDGSLNYQVTAHPKASQFTPQDGESRTLRVVKQWKDSGYEEHRPDSVTVDIYRDGVFMTAVQLSPENNWSYSWTAEADGAKWTAVEREIPPEYTVTIEHKGDTVILTNVRDSENPPPPTGDTFVAWPYILVMCISGCAIILLVLWQNKKGRE